MSMLLWKTLALGGVIGVGSVVVVTAQKSLDQDSKVALDEFELLDGDTGLETTFAVSETGAGDPSQPQKFVVSDAVKPALAADNAVVPDGNPFGVEPVGAEITRAAAEVSEGGDPFAPAQSEPQDEPSEPGTSTVTLDEPAGDQFALLDPNASPQAPQQEEPDPFAVEPASSSIPEEPAEPLKKLSPGNDGPVLMRTPSDEPAPQPADDNPFAQYLKAPASAGGEPAANEAPPAASQVDAPATLFPPLRTREAAEPAATMPLDLPTPRLQPEMSDVPRRRREEAAAQSEFEVATQQEAGLAAPQPPALPEVSPENAPGRMRVAEAEIEPVASPPAEEPGAFNFPPLDLTAAQDQAGGPRTIPADASSIPGQNSSVPQTTDTVPESRTSIPDAGALQADDFNPDESPNRSPVGFPASSLPVPGNGARPAAPPAGVPAYDDFPAANEPVAPPPVAPATPPPAAASPDLSGFGVVDRNFATGPSQPQLTIVKEAPSEAVIGQDLEYSILVKNIGRSAAHNVVVEDLIPRGSKCTGTIPKAESQLEKKNLLWKLGTIAPGAEQLLRVRITPTDAGEIGSVATVSFSAEVASRTVIVEPRAALVVSGRQDAVVGEPNQYRFVLTNNGPIDLKGVFVRTVLPGEGLTHPGGNDLEYEVGDLPRGKSRDVTLALTPSQPGDWKFQSIVTLGGRELAKAVTDVHAVAARLTVVRSGPTKRFVGRSATYSNTVSNSSTQVLSNVTVVETLPNGLDPSGQLSNNVRWDPARRTLTWVIPQLGPGQIVDLPCTVTPKVAGNLEGQVVARDASGNHAELATALDVAGFSSLVVDGGHDGTPVAVGDQVSFRFKVKNRGTAAAEQVVASFELPDEVEFISAQGPGNVKFERLGRVILFDPMPTVPVNTELTYDVVVQAKAVTPASGDKRIGVKLYSTQLPTDRPLEQEQQLVIYGDDEVAQPVQRASGVR